MLAFDLQEPFTANAEVAESWDKSMMECLSKTKPLTVTMLRPQPSHGVKDHQSQTDSFLTAARLIRNGCTDGGRRFTIADRPVHPPAVTKPKPAEMILKASSIRQVTNSRRADEDKQIIPKQMTNKVKQTSNQELSANKQVEQQMLQAGTVIFHVSGCRIACRQSRRFKAPLLPVIAEI